jgi:MoaA/NifB/PqqE/SkfB family radical SAM enzyme
MVNKNNIRVKGIRFHRHVLIEITKKCNLYCRHCFTSAGKKLDNELSQDEWLTAAEDLCSNNFNAFTISGGEPLLELTKTVSLAKKIRLLNQKAKIYLFTNGLFLRDEHMPVIKTYFNGVGTSIDGNEPTHDWIRNRPGSYQSTIKSIGMLNKHKIPVFIQSMVTPQTQPYLPSVVRMAVQKKIKAIRFSHVDFFGRAKLQQELLGSSPESLKSLSNQVKKFNKKFNIYITTNLLTKKTLVNDPDKFRTPSLHVLPDGTVLPWYGLPNKFSLWKYPKESLACLEQEKLSDNIKNFYKLVDTARREAICLNRETVDFDNMIALCL